MELALHEDIGAELDYFVFLALLGIDNEAKDFASSVLWNHLQFFPVTAEIAGYLIEQDDIDQVRQLLERIQTASIPFDDAEETLLLTHLTQVVDQKDATAHVWRRNAEKMILEFNGWESETLCLTLNIKMIVAARSPAQELDIRDFSEDLLYHYFRLVNRQMFEDAARVFSIACLAAAGQKSLTHASQDAFQQAFEILVYCLEQDQQSPNSADAGNGSVYILLACTSHLKFLADLPEYMMSNRQATDQLTPLLERTQELLVAHFDVLSDPTPRGRCFMFCEELNKRLAKLNEESDDENETMQQNVSDIRDLDSGTWFTGPFSMFPRFSVSLRIGNNDRKIKSASENVTVGHNLLSASTAQALGIQWKRAPVDQIGRYQIIGCSHLTWYRGENPNDQRMSTGDWYITPTTLPDNIQALIGSSPLSSRAALIRKLPYLESRRTSMDHSTVQSTDRSTTFSTAYSTAHSMAHSTVHSTEDSTYLSLKYLKDYNFTRMDVDSLSDIFSDYSLTAAPKRPSRTKFPPPDAY